jgi:tellurite resistance protein TerC
MGLRQLFFLIGDLVQRMAYLSIGLAVVLGFIGLKLILEALHGSGVDDIASIRLPTIAVGPSLIFIVAILTMTAIASAARNRYRPDSDS